MHHLFFPSHELQVRLSVPGHWIGHRTCVVMGGLAFRENNVLICLNYKTTIANPVLNINPDSIQGADILSGGLK